MKDVLSSVTVVSVKSCSLVGLKVLGVFMVGGGMSFQQLRMKIMISSSNLVSISIDASSLEGKELYLSLHFLLELSSFVLFGITLC